MDSCDQTHWRSPWLLGSKCLHRVKTRGAPCGYETCGCCDEQQGSRHKGKDRGIEGLGFVQHGLEYPDCLDACCKANDQSEDCGSQSVGESEAQDLFALCAECNADSDFDHTLGHEIRQNSVEANRGEEQRERCEGENERRAETRVANGVSDELSEGEYIRNGKLRIELGDLLLNGDRHGQRIRHSAHGEGKAKAIPGIP